MEKCENGMGGVCLYEYFSLFVAIEEYCASFGQNEGDRYSRRRHPDETVMDVS